MKVTEEHPVIQMAQRLGKRLAETEEIIRFRQAEEQIANSQRVQGLIEAIKKKQKELVHARHYKKRHYMEQLKQELDLLQHDFDQLPIVREYQQSQVEINQLLQIIQQVVANSLSRKIEVETGGNVANGCAGGGACGCK